MAQPPKLFFNNNYKELKLKSNNLILNDTLSFKILFDRIVYIMEIDMKKMLWIAIVFPILSYANLPLNHTSLLKYVQEAPDQGETGTCLFMATTGAVELLLNKHYNITDPKAGDINDISEIYTINQRASYSGSWHQMVVPRFNYGWAIRHNDLVFKAKNQDGSDNMNVWRKPSNWSQLPRMSIKESFTSRRLFIRGNNRFSKYVIRDGDIDLIKQTLNTTNSPVLINYNHNGWWHVVLIVGYDDEASGTCLHTPQKECSGKGAFWVRDSLGIKTHLRDYDWFRVNANAAFSVTMR